MIDDFNQLPDQRALCADICIVGAGAAGLLIASEFVGSGKTVIVVESGGWKADQDHQALYDGQIAGGAFRGLQAGRARVFGGTTTLWGGQCIPLDPIDFEQRDWVTFSGWPITAAELGPYYERAKQRLNIVAEAYDRPVWERFGLDELAFDRSCLRPVHGVFIRQPDLGRRFRDMLRAARNVRVLLHANVLRLKTDAYATQVTGVELGSLGGRRGRVVAKQVVLCAGGIENARLLLLSDDVNPAGLGNDRDLVGRFLQDHPCGHCAVIETTHPRVLQDHWNMLYGRGVRYLPKLALSEQVQRTQRVLNCVGRLAYEYAPQAGVQLLRDLAAELKLRRMPANLARRVGRLCLASPGLGRDAWRLLGKGLSPAPRPTRINLEAFSEQTPDPNSRVTLSGRSDALGLRQTCVDWRLDALAIRTLGVFARTVRTEFARLGIGGVVLSDWLSDESATAMNMVDSYHPAGTTRMASDPSAGVVDTNCQVFGVGGLFIAGSSVFPTSGAANPTLTIAAIALRVADRLRHAATIPDSAMSAACGPRLVAATASTP